MPKKTYRVRNWSEYNQSLVQRGSITLWMSEEVIQQWNTPVQTGKRGRPQKYSNALILCALQLKAFYNLTFRSVEGFMGSVIQLLKLDMQVPDYTTLSKRQANIHISLSQHFDRRCELHLVVDSTGSTF